MQRHHYAPYFPAHHQGQPPHQGPGGHPTAVPGKFLRHAMRRTRSKVSFGAPASHISLRNFGSLPVPQVAFRTYWAISKDCLLASSSHLSVTASASLANVMPCSLLLAGSRKQTMKDVVPSFFVRFRMLAIGKMLRRCTHILAVCTQSEAQRASDLRKPVPRWDSNRIPALATTWNSRKHTESGPVRHPYDPIRSHKCGHCPHAFLPISQSGAAMCAPCCVVPQLEIHLAAPPLRLRAPQEVPPFYLCHRANREKQHDQSPKPESGQPSRYRSADSFQHLLVPRRASERDALADRLNGLSGS